MNMKILGRIFIVIATLNTIFCVQETREYTVNFSVDANEVRNVVKLGIRGNIKPLSWEKDIALFDNDHDGIYEGEVKIVAPYALLEYKFVLNDRLFELKDKPNRKLYLGEEKQLFVKSIFDLIAN